MPFVSWCVEPADLKSVFRASMSWGPGTVTVETDERGDVVRVRLSNRCDERSSMLEGPAGVALQQVRDYLSGRRVDFDVTCRMKMAKPFHRAVLEALIRIGYGQVVTYGELARLAGRPSAARAVGRVMASNPCPVFVPCHRVVAVGGLGGYGPGLSWKRALLSLEGWTLDAKGNLSKPGENPAQTR